MLAVSPLRNTNNDEKQGQMESFQMGVEDNFPDFSDGNLLDSINFDDLFAGINEGDVLPDLEMDSEILAGFSTSGGEEYEMNTSTVSMEKVENSASRREEEEDPKVSGTLNDSNSSSTKEESVSKRKDSAVTTNSNTSQREADKGRKSSSQRKNPQGKRKVKVDWTPELHRRFVQAVEQLGVDKAVPSRILELMGIDCLTRHNIASHLQKYRSHRKHLLAREAEAASWNQRRQMYGTAAAMGGGKRDINPWLAPTMGFPPAAPVHHFRPLHVWGHPSVDQSLMPIWPKHLPHSPSPPPAPPATPTWPTAIPPPPAPDPSYWHSHHQCFPSAQTPGTPYFPQPVAAPTRFAAHPPVPGIPPHSMYKIDPGIGVPTGQSKESIDAALGDVLSKPWLPLPIGLKPPALDSVMEELHRQGISKVPPNSA